MALIALVALAAVAVVAIAVSLGTSGGSSKHNHSSSVPTIAAYVTDNAPPGATIGVAPGVDLALPAKVNGRAVASVSEVTTADLRWILTPDPPGLSPVARYATQNGTVVGRDNGQAVLYALAAAPSPPTTAPPPTTVPPPTSAPPPTTAAPLPTTSVPTATVPPPPTGPPPATVPPPTTVPPSTTAPSTTLPTSPPAPGANSPPTRSGPSPKPGVGPTSVTVSPGASFWTLAQEVASARLGHPASNGEIAAVWNALIAANAAHLVVPGDANLIYPGQVFTVPPP